MANDNRSRAEGTRPRRVNQTTILLIISALFVAVAFGFMYPAFFAGARKSAVIKIPKNATSEMLRDSVAKYEGDKYASHVMRLVAIRKTDLTKRYGAYRIEKGQSPFVAMRHLTSGGQTPVSLTLNGTRRLRNIAEYIGGKLDASPDSIYSAITDPDFLATYGLTPENAKALFLEDTHQVYWTDSPRQVLKKIGDNYKNVWNDRRVKEAKELGLTPVQATIICSIIDEETNNINEKGRIARVYINRLNSGMKLQSDPTVRFAIGDFTIKRVTGQHLKYDSPYNTYMYAGLPPGPIRTTSARTIDALLESEPSFDLYMCAREDFSGMHNFAATYEEHLENARRYQEALDARGIK